MKPDSRNLNKKCRRPWLFNSTEWQPCRWGLLGTRGPHRLQRGCRRSRGGRGAFFPRNVWTPQPKSPIISPIIIITQMTKIKDRPDWKNPHRRAKQRHTPKTINTNTQERNLSVARDREMRFFFAISAEVKLFFSLSLHLFGGGMTQHLKDFVLESNGFYFFS